MRLTRSKIKSLTSNHCYYKNYHLEPDEDIGNASPVFPNIIKRQVTLKIKEISTKKDKTGLDTSEKDRDPDQQKSEHNELDKKLIKIEENLRDARNGKADSADFALVKEDKLQD